MAGKQNSDAASTSGGGGNAFETFRDYLTESKAEIKKVTWPTKKEARVTSIAVLVLVVVMAIFLGLVDLGMTKIIELILS
ncbi:preprotein translocase subunit SecE [Desulfovibrio sp. OttesenSCG-928-O18]|nr:preprotein translocase subunit SecE [Desulfovibrio sp. OttesenSCG-928-O18]